MDRRGVRSHALLAAALALLAAPAHSETLRVGKAVAQNFGYAVLDVGIAQGLFQKQGLGIEETSFAGGAKQVQALTASAIDIALGAGTDMAFILKGAPMRAVGTIAETPVFLGVSLGAQSPVKSVDDLKGKRIGVTTVGSLTMWLVQELNRVKGWGANGAVPVVIGGSLPTEYAALKTGEVDAIMGAAADGYLLQERGQGRLLLDAASYVKEFEIFTIFASEAEIEQHPDAVRRFLKTWYETVAYMKTHRGETVAIAGKVTGLSPSVEAREYDTLMPALSTDGRFQKAALDRLDASLVDLKVLKNGAGLSKLYTEEFLDRR